MITGRHSRGIRFVLAGVSECEGDSLACRKAEQAGCAEVGLQFRHARGLDQWQGCQMIADRYPVDLEDLGALGPPGRGSRRAVGNP